MEDFRDTLKETLHFYLEEEKRLTSLLAALPKGTIRKKKINGSEYYYLKYRKGDKVIEEYLGKEIPDTLLNELKKRKKLEKELKKVRDIIKELTRKKENSITLIPPLENFLKIMTEENMWDEGIEIIGAWCFVLYQKYLPVRKYPLRTQDVDILIPYPYGGKAFDISKYLKELGFTEHINPDYSVYYTGHGIKIEFLAPEKGKGKQKAPYIKKLRITPQTPRFMTILFEESIVLSIGKGIKVRVPSPASFFLHKLLISSKRKKQGKKEKDLREAIYTGEYILKDPVERAKLENMIKKIPDKWKKRIMNALKESLELMPQEDVLIHSLMEILPHKI